MTNKHVLGSSHNITYHTNLSKHLHILNLDHQLDVKVHDRRVTTIRVYTFEESKIRKKNIYIYVIVYIDRLFI